MATKSISIGPVHSGAHGFLKLDVDVDGDIVRKVEPRIGMQHRGVEKLLETRLYMQSPSYMERLDYLAPLSWDNLFVSAVEKATRTEVKERAKYARMILLEFERMASHLFWLGSFCNGMKIPIAVEGALADREMIIRFLERVAGSKVFYTNLRLGGLDRDLPREFRQKSFDLADYMEDRVHEYRTLLEGDSVFLEKTRNVGVLKPMDARDGGVTGPVLRGSGIAEDVRKSKPYYHYDKIDFTVPVQTRADCLGRYRIRIEELWESTRIVRQVLEKMPQTGDVKGLPISTSGPDAIREPVLISRELPRGEGLIYLVPGKQKPERVSLRSPSFANLSAVSKACEGAKLSDVHTILGSFDIVISEVDR